jgi:putative DNA methylase
VEQQIAYEKRLIEETFPVKEISEESAKEKIPRQSHISTLHIWWARRPLASSRATNYAALVRAPQSDQEREKLRRFIVELSKWENATNRTLIEKAQTEILSENFGKPQRILDSFAGGGAIPLEALRLGCDVYSSDLNPVAVLILKCTVEYPERFRAHTIKSVGGLTSTFKNQLVNDVKKWGRWVFEQAQRQISEFYEESNGSRSVGYIWARTIPCQNPSCNAEIPLIRQYWLAKRTTKKISLFPTVTNKRLGWKIVGTGYDQFPSGFDPEKGTVSQAVAVCPICKSITDDKMVRKLIASKKTSSRMIAVVSHRDGVQGKSYRLASQKDVHTFGKADELLNEKRLKLKEQWGQDPVPDEFIHTPDNKEYKPGGLLYNFTPVLLYGMTRWGDLFNSRQKLALITFGEQVRRSYELIRNETNDDEYAKAVSTYLGIAFDHIVEKNNVLSRWRNTAEAIAGCFSRQALSMVWDYFESNPFSGSTGDWLSAIDYMCKVIEQCTFIDRPATVSQSSSTLLSYPDEFFDAVFTDPPYYDNVPYADLSDFFYVWLKRTIGQIHPDLFSTPLTPKSDEAIAELPLLRGMNKIDAAKLLKDVKTQEQFEDSLSRSFKEFNRVLKPNGISVIVYAHKSTAGWETLVNSLLDSGLVVTGSWPIHTEMKSRLRAKESAALASSIYMISRKAKKLPTGFYKEVKQELESHLNKRLDSLWKEGISGADFFISAIGSAIQVFGIYEQVIDDEGQTVRADRLLEDLRRIVADYAVRQVLHNGFAAEISQMTRFYVLWRWAYGDAKLDFDDARKLASGVGIDLALEWNRGFIRKDNECIEVLGPEERRSKDLQGSKEIIDVLHHVLLLWKQGKNDDVVGLLKETGLGHSDVFFKVAQAISESLSIETKEKKLLDGFLSGRQRIAENMRKVSGQTRLFEKE